MVTWRERLHHAAASPRAQWALALVSATESIFFPLPPDPMLLAMGLLHPRQVFRLAALTTAASVFGGVLGYSIGALFMDTVGWPLVQTLGLAAHYATIQSWYRTYDAWAVVVAGLTPVPYKVCTLTAGAFGINLGIFTLASIVGRGLRFFAVAAAVYWLGEKARHLVLQRLNWILSGCVLIVLVAALVYRLW